MNNKTKVLVALIGIMTGGCQQNYYRITDLNSGKQYYTTGYTQDMHGRHETPYRFRELGTDDEILLQAARATRVTAQEARTATRRYMSKVYHPLVR